MIYFVEMALDDLSLEKPWHDWYLAHIKKLLTVPGFRGSQRFASLVPAPSPWAAMHEVASPALFESPEYRAVGGPTGTGEWQHRMSNWHRNLLEGVDQSPEVPMDQFLAVIDDAPELALPAGTTPTRLRPVGLDRTLKERVIAVVRDAAPFAALAKRDTRVRVFRPITGKLRAA